jgi:hypothetical protein
MLSRIRKRVTYANVAMTLALIFAMTGGAYAAGKILITSTKQIKPSVLKQLQGKAGKTGPAGANGAQGPQGTAGANGKDGAPGANGKDGTSVTSATEPKGAHCAEGGSSFTAADGTTYACNGKAGKAGEPWTPNNTLPSGATETGTWATAGQAAEYGGGFAWLAEAPISFTVQLSAALEVSHVHVIKPGDPLPSGCTGSLEEPGAESGNLCVFVAESSGAEAVTVHRGGLTSAKGASKAGAVVLADAGSKPAEGIIASGTWAVTG